MYLTAWAHNAILTCNVRLTPAPEKLNRAGPVQGRDPHGASSPDPEGSGRAWPPASERAAALQHALGPGDWRRCAQVSHPEFEVTTTVEFLITIQCKHDVAVDLKYMLTLLCAWERLATSERVRCSTVAATGGGAPSMD